MVRHQLDKVPNSIHDSAHRTLKEKMSHYDLKSWVTGGTKIRSRILSNQIIFESNWLSISSQNYQYRVKTINIESKLDRYWESIWLKYSPISRNPGRILVPPVTQLFRSKWLNFSFQCIFYQHSVPYRWQWCPNVLTSCFW